MKKLYSEGKITTFKSLAISKILHLAIIMKVPNTVIEELKQNKILWDNSKLKTKKKHLTQ